MIDTLLNRECKVTRRTPSTTTDDYGNQVPSFTTSTTRCALQQRRTGENEAELSDSAWVAFLPAGTVIDTDDSLEVDGDVFQVDGEAYRVHDELTGREHHVEVKLRRTATGEGVPEPGSGGSGSGGSGGSGSGS